MIGLQLKIRMADYCVVIFGGDGYDAALKVCPPSFFVSDE